MNNLNEKEKLNKLNNKLKQIKKNIEILSNKNSTICVKKSYIESKIEDLKNSKNVLCEYMCNLSKSRFLAIVMPIIPLIFTNVLGIISSALINFSFIEIMIIMNIVGVFLTSLSIDVWVKEYIKMKKFVKNNTFYSIDMQIEELILQKDLYIKKHLSNNNEIKKLNDEKEYIKKEIYNVLNINNSDTLKIENIDLNSFDLLFNDELENEENEKSYTITKTKKKRKL